MDNKIRTLLTIIDSLENNNEAHLILKNMDNEWIHAEIQPSDYWLGGDSGGWTTDFNVRAETSKEMENFIKREYIEIYVYEDYMECRDAWEEITGENW